MKKILRVFIFSLLFILVGCNNNKGTDIVNNFPYYEQKLSVNSDYNTDLYYLNSLEFEVADPSVIYIEEGDQAGYFYAYGTSDDIRVYGFQSWRSKDLTHWESMGIALKPDFNNTWAITNYWAPEVLFDPSDGLYYMFYSAQTKDSGVFQLSVAYSENPQGPFVSPNNIRNADGKMLSPNQPVYDFKSTNSKINPSIVRRNAIDISPFIDPVTKEKYIYFSYYDSFNQSEIFGCKMKDWYTPDYSTLVQLTAVGYLTVEDGINKNINARVPEGTINEGPFMYYHNGTYYMTLSVYGYTDEKYQVRQALSDSPLGTFVKPLPEKGGTVLATDPMWGHITSAGHHSFVQVGDELLIAYHTFLNRTDISEGRALAFDKVVFTEIEGLKLLHSNGPTYSLQPLPEKVSGYKNIAPDATITANNTASTSDVKYLNDGLIPFLSIDNTPEYRANIGTSTITLTWDDFVTARAIMIYNSVFYEDSFLSVARIDITYKADKNGGVKIARLGDLEFDWDWNVEANFDAMKPGGAVIAEFNELPVKQIQITIDSVAESYLGIPEIVVLGKSSAISHVSKFETYSYQNPELPSPELVTEGTTIGSTHGLKTNFGYDLTHDDGTEDAYIVQNWPYDQYAYFKDIWSTSFYVEAEFTVTNNTSYANDLYPKFGLTVISPENTIFFFVDANPTYTKDALGTAQRKLDNSDWDWNATEQNVAGVGISYRDGDFVKLAIIRQGKEFYMIANDKLIIYYDEFNVFNDRYESTVGFLTFNTELLIKNYYATMDQSVVSNKLSLYRNEVNGETFGVANGYKTTPGWDLSTDDGTENAYLESVSTGDQYAYFKGFSGNYFYAETKITVVKDLKDPYPKFGFALRNGENSFFYYIDGVNNYTNQAVGYVTCSGTDWNWAGSKSIPVNSISYKDGEYVTLGLLRDGNKIYLFVNGVHVSTATSIPGFDESSNSVVSILSFTTGVRVKDYFITSSQSVVESYRPA